jgi:hypothetical protein
MKSRNTVVYILAMIFFVAAAGLVAVRIRLGGHNIQVKDGRNLWRVTTVVDVKGKGDPAHVRLTLPNNTNRQKIYNEISHSGDMVFYTRDREKTGNLMGFWKSEFLDGTRTITYRFSVQPGNVQYALPPTFRLPADPFEYYPEELHSWLKPSRKIQSKNQELRRVALKLRGGSRDLLKVNRRLFDFVADEVEYKSETGSKDALTALKDMSADCGGQARLFVALSRAVGIPSRLVGGIILQDEIKKDTHVWAENYLNGQWIPFDVVNGYYAKIPANYLELYRADKSLIGHSGLESINWFFVIQPERIPPVDQAWSLYVLPIHFQTLVQTLLLIPVGILVVSFMRVVIGIKTFGTFTPVLIALALRQVTLWPGLLVLMGIVLFGCLFRRVLDRLKLLIIPRLSIIITIVILAIVGLMLAGFYAGKLNYLYVSFFPIIIITWIIERFSISQIEDGMVCALKDLAGTLVVSVITFYVLDVPFLRTSFFSFPELLLAVIGAQLILGRYTWMRATELLRFSALFALEKSRAIAQKSRAS